MSVVIVPKFNFPNYIETIEKHRVTHLLYVKDRWSTCSVFNPGSFQDRTSNNHPISQGNLQIRSLPTRITIHQLSRAITDLLVLHPCESCLLQVHHSANLFSSLQKSFLRPPLAKYMVCTVLRDSTMSLNIGRHDRSRRIDWPYPRRRDSSISQQFRSCCIQRRETPSGRHLAHSEDGRISGTSRGDWGVVGPDTIRGSGICRISK
jgi:hypothetical protein